MIKEFIEAVKEDPKEAIESFIMLSTTFVLFYVSMWMFY